MPFTLPSSENSGMAKVITINKYWHMCRNQRYLIYCITSFNKTRKKLNNVCMAYRWFLCVPLAISAIVNTRIKTRATWKYKIVPSFISNNLCIYSWKSLIGDERTNQPRTELQTEPRWEAPNSKSAFSAISKFLDFFSIFMTEKMSTPNCRS